MSSFASGTAVPVDRSKLEIERLLVRYGATKFGSGWDERGATIIFEANERRVKFVLPLPDRSEKRFAKNGLGKPREKRDIDRVHEQACRQRWRSLALVIKAKLEAVASGITSFESEFLAHVVLPGGETVNERLAPLLVEAYSSGVMPPLMLGSGK